MSQPMRIETKFLRLREAVAWGHEIDGWQVCWRGGWDKWRMFYIVMVIKTPTAAKKKPRTVGRAAGLWWPGLKRRRWPHRATGSGPAAIIQLTPDVGRHVSIMNDS